MAGYFPKLRSAQVVEKALDRICARGTMGCVIGNAGVGKTVPLRAWRQRANKSSNPLHRHIWIEATIGGSLQALITALASALGVPPASVDSTSASIAVKLAADPVAVIIDECDFLQMTALVRCRAIFDRVQMLRDTEDERGFPLVLIGTEALRKKLERDEDRCEQILSRIDEIHTVPKMSRAECAGILEAKFGLDGSGEVSLGPGAVEAIDSFINGSFRWLDRIVPKAIELAKKDGMIITPKTVEHARRYLAGNDQ